MATNSPRTGLLLPEDGDYQDAAVLASNFSKIDQNLGAIVCTSTTRPSSPYAGMLIYETDTGKMLVRPASGEWLAVVNTKRNARVCSTAADATDAGLAVASGWSFSHFRYEIFDQGAPVPLAYTWLRVIRTGSQLVPNATGQLAGTQIATLPNNLRPSSYVGGLNGGNSAVINAIINSGGSIELHSAGGPINTGDAAVVTGVYPVWS